MLTNYTCAPKTIMTTTTAFFFWYLFFTGNIRLRTNSFDHVGGQRNHVGTESQSKGGWSVMIGDNRGAVAVGTRSSDVCFNKLERHLTDDGIVNRIRFIQERRAIKLELYLTMTSHRFIVQNQYDAQRASLAQTSISHDDYTDPLSPWLLISNS